MIQEEQYLVLEISLTNAADGERLGLKIAAI
jgi:hypothetical protein